MTSLGKVNVIGAGVVGLTTALLLQSKGYQVTVIADYFPGDYSVDYTSPFAGARWKTLAPNSDLRLQRYDAISFKFFWELARSQAAEAGIMVVPSYDYFQVANESVLNPWFKDIVPTFQMIDKNQLPKGISAGYHYTTVTINPLVYLPWLLKQFLVLGGQRRKQTLSHLSDAITDDVDIIVNCAGVRAKDLGGVVDTKVTPTRGQNVIVYAPHIRTTLSSTKLHSYTYIIPRSDGTVILGTTKETANSDTSVNEETTKDILERACDLCPDLILAHESVDDLKIVGNLVGLRPTREGGPRVQNEYYTSASGKQILITHNYGHGGSGYQSSWGTAKEAIYLIHEGHTVLRHKSKELRDLLSRL